MRKYAGNPWLVLLVVSLGFFMTLLDLTIVNIAIPNMITKLHASLDDVLWVINAYALVLAVLVITTGRLGDLFGPRILFMNGVAVFTAASAACGLAPSPGWLIAFRAVQGLGAAMLMPQTLTIITNTFPPERRGAAFGIWGAVAGVATIAGPTLGGLLVSAFDWRYIFFVNVPIGVIVLLITPVLIPNLRLGRKHRIDIPGVLLASAALLAICYGLVEGQKYDWGTITSFISIPLILGVGVVLLVAFLIYQKMTQGQEPLVPFAVFRDRNFTVVNWVSGVLAIGMMGIFLPFTIYLQSVLGFSALKAGLAMAPASVISMFIAPVAGRLTDKIGGKYILMSGLLLFGFGMGWLALIASPSFVVAGLPGPAARGRGRHGLHVRAAGHHRHAQHPAADGGGGVGRAEHDQAGRPRDRHGHGRRSAAEPPGGGYDQPGRGPLGRAARAGARPVHHRDPEDGAERHPGRGGPERRPEQAVRPARQPGRGGREDRPRSFHVRVRGRDEVDHGAARVLLTVAALSCLAIQQQRKQPAPWLLAQRVLAQRPTAP